MMMQFPGLRHSSYYNTLLILLFLIFTNNNNHVTAMTGIPDNVKVPALIVFGDSMFDTGNNNNFRTNIRADYPPYGSNLGVATGRFSNSKVLPDIIANELGIKDSVPAYLKSDLQSKDLLTGVSFASGGAGFDSQTSSNAAVKSLDDQIKMYKEYKEKIQELVGLNRSISRLAQSFHLVSVGSNDIFKYFSAGVKKPPQYDVGQFTTLMASNAVKFVSSLYEAGARKIGVLSIPPVGCFPSQRSKGTDACSDKVNQMAVLANSKFSTSLASLTLPDAKIVFMDFYTDFLDIVQNPDQNGFIVGNKPCCAIGKQGPGVAYLCNKVNSTTCPDNTEYVFWDGFHFTEDAYWLLYTKFFQRQVAEFF